MIRCWRERSERCEELNWGATYLFRVQLPSDAVFHPTFCSVLIFMPLSAAAVCSNKQLCHLKKKQKKKTKVWMHSIFRIVTGSYYWDIICVAVCTTGSQLGCSHTRAREHGLSPPPLPHTHIHRQEDESGALNEEQCVVWDLALCYFKPGKHVRVMLSR